MVNVELGPEDSSCAVASAKICVIIRVNLCPSKIDFTFGRPYSLTPSRPLNL